MPTSVADSASQPIRVLITAGPTHEPIDAVRHIANRSSGQMGLALTAAACTRGWNVTLLLGPTHLEPPAHSNLRVHRFRTTAELQALIAEQWPHSDVLIMAAAVADFRPKMRAEPMASTKLRRTDAGLTLELEPTPDLLAEAAARARTTQTVIGFALEPINRLMNAAHDKLARKNLDFIVANPLETIDAATVRATLLGRHGQSASPQTELKKSEFADWLLSQVEGSILLKLNRNA